MEEYFRMRIRSSSLGFGGGGYMMRNGEGKKASVADGAAVGSHADGAEEVFLNSAAAARFGNLDAAAVRAMMLKSEGHVLR